MPVKTPGQIQKRTCPNLECFSESIDSFSQAARKPGCTYLKLFSGHRSSPGNDTCILDVAAYNPCCQVITKN
jgi:hypothetical protein